MRPQLSALIMLEFALNTTPVNIYMPLKVDQDEVAIDQSSINCYNYYSTHFISTNYVAKANKTSYAN